MKKSVFCALSATCLVGFGPSAAHSQQAQDVDPLGAPPDRGKNPRPGSLPPARGGAVVVRAHSPAATPAEQTLVDLFGGSEADSTPNAPRAVADPQPLPAAAAKQVRADLAIGFAGADGGGAALADTLQLVGQLVADRASARAFELAARQLTQGLHCEAPVKEHPEFTATCAAIQRLRIEDLAAAPKVLVEALGVDLITYIAKRVATLTEAGPASPMSALVDDVLLPFARNDGRARTEQDVLRFLVTLVPSDGAGKQDPAVRIGALASVAAIRCVKSRTVNSVACSIPLIVAEMCEERACALEAASIASVASDLEVAIAATRPSPFGPDIERRIDGSVAALTHLTCIAAQQSCESIAVAKVNARPEPKWEAARLMLRLRALVHAIATGDGLGVGLAMARTVDDALVMRGAADAQLQRATRVLATLVNYSATYAGPDATSTEADSTRRQILESLSREFTDRTGREGDVVVSIGGSLRAAAGLRVGRAKPAFYGPASLVLGVGFDIVQTSGLHLELGLVDLGEYLAFTRDDGPFAVDEPNARQAFSPSLTVAWSFAGPSMPLFAGVVGGAAPFRDDAAELRWYTGVAAGVHVPLFDLN